MTDECAVLFDDRARLFLDEARRAPFDRIAALGALAGDLGDFNGVGHLGTIVTGSAETGSIGVFP